MKPIRIAHLSDLHFSSPSWRLSQFFSKRWIGNLNLLIRRKGEFVHEKLYTLPKTFLTNKIDLILLTGDFTSTSDPKEFSSAQTFVEELKKTGCSIFTIPGNHDQYTKSAFKKKLYYKYFPEDKQLESRQVSVYPLKNKWWLVLLDTAIATSLLSSCGDFSKKCEEALIASLEQIPSDHSILIANHFPLINNDQPNKALQNSQRLEGILKRFPNVKLYLHGHNHRHCIADLRPNGLPILVDSGCTSHRDKASWNLLELEPQACTVQGFEWNTSEELPWKKFRTESFSW